VAQAPEHVIENIKLAGKAARDGKKAVKRQPPEKNFVNWDKKTFERLMAAQPERLTSRFQVTHATLLNVLSREGDGCAAIRSLLRDCHESPKQKQVHVRRSWQLFRSLVERKIVEFVEPGSRRREADDSSGVPSPTPHVGGYKRKLRVNVELQDDFSMDQALSLYLLETIPLVDPLRPDYALVLLTLVESILEDPAAILRKQLDRVKDQKMAEMKMAGIEYDKRMEELEKLEHPKPEREFVYSTFNAFADRHPWVGQENIRPKSIAREMFETFRSFADYIRDYELQKSEGLLLRHLNSVFKVLSQTVPDAAKSEQVREMEIYLGDMLRQVDSSLLDEWEKMRDPNFQRAEMKEVRPAGAEEAAKDITRDTKAFTAAIRNRVFTFLRGLAVGDFEGATEVLAVPLTPTCSSSKGEREKSLNGDVQPWTSERLAAAMDAYHVSHQRLCLDPNARNSRHTYVTPSDDRKTWRVQQMLVDPEEHNDWVAEFEVDLAASREAEEPVMRLTRIGSLT
jgi:Domain of unknown function (DUF3516)